MHTLTPLRRRLLLLLAVAGMAAYIGLAAAVDAQPLADALRGLGSSGVAAVLALSLFNYVLRFLRWAAYLRLLGHRVPALRHLLIYFGGFAFTVSPGKAGEALRSLYLRPHGVPLSTSLAALFSERLMDVLTMVLLALLLVAAATDARPVLVVLGCSFLGITLASGHPALPALLRRAAPRLGGRARTAIQGLAAMFESAASLLRPRVVSWALVTGAVAWGAEGYGLYLLTDSHGLKLDVAAATGVYALAVLAGVASFFMPGGLGGMEAAMTALLVAAGAGLAAAFAITVLCRLATLWFAVALGIAALLWLELLAASPAIETAPGP